MRRVLRVLVRDVVLNVLLASSLMPRGLRWRLLRLLGADVEQCAISSNLWLASRKLGIGRGSYFNYGCRIDNQGARVSVGRDCAFGVEVALLTSSHELGGGSRRAGAVTAAPITVDDGVWIGARSVVLPGVTIGKGAVVAAGSVVREDVRPHTLVAGVPAVWKRDLPVGDTSDGVVA